MRKTILFIVLFSALSLCSNAQIKINSEPSGAKVYQEGKYIGVTPCSASTNMKAKKLVYDIDADKVRDPSKPPYSIEFTLTMDGYEPATVCFEGEYEYHQSGWVGGGQKYYIVKPKSYNLFAVLKKEQNINISPIQTTQPENQNIIIQEKKEDIRWQFDSEPDGARVFWKVISLEPNVVKNTDPLYLGTTPYNELKPFNIKGLNSENSKNVTIEIEISKKGYKKQIKRFSAESITEQNEISWFFELEKESMLHDTIMETIKEPIEDD